MVAEKYYWPGLTIDGRCGPDNTDPPYIGQEEKCSRKQKPTIQQHRRVRSNAMIEYISHKCYHWAPGCYLRILSRNRGREGSWYQSG